eukprot:m51a1_g7983 hypothetical protein (201) ;mRNA; f:71804-72406
MGNMQYQCAQDGDVDGLVAAHTNGAPLEHRIRGWTALMTACFNGREDAAHALLLLGADPNARSVPDGRTALHLAASSGHARIVADLVACGADPAVLSADGSTAVHAAAQCGGPAGDEGLRELLRAGGPAGLARPRGNGYTPLHCAAAAGNESGAKILLAAGVDPRARAQSVRGETAIELARAHGHQGVVRVLEYALDNPF